MAANLAGMFAQLNNAIGRNPLTSGAGQRMLDMGSQNLATGVSAGAGMAGQQVDPYSMMTQGAKQRQGQQDMGQLDLSSPKGMKEAAMVYQKMGKTKEALQLMQQAQLLEDRLEKKALAEQAKTNAILDAGNASIQEEAVKKRNKAQKYQAKAWARRNGDFEAARALDVGTLSPEAYIEKAMEEKKLYELSKDEGLFDKDGNRLALNPSGPKVGDKKGELSVHDKKQWDELTTSSYEASAWANKATALAEQVANSSEWKAGLENTVEDTLLGMMGKRDEPQYLRTQVNSIRNHDAIGMLPPGPASDRDIEIVMKGVPPENAGREEVTAFLEATAKVSAKLADHDKMRAKYTIEQNREAFQEDWDAKMQKEARTERINETPQWAIEALQGDPALRDDFLANYGWLPEGVE